MNIQFIKYFIVLIFLKDLKKLAQSLFFFRARLAFMFCCEHIYQGMSNAPVTDEDVWVEPKQYITVVNSS